MRSTEVVNAFLLDVREAPSGDAWDGTESPGAAVWGGRAGVYYEVARDRRAAGQPGQETSDVSVTQSLIVSADLGIDWRIGHTITIERQGTTLTGSVKATEPDATPPGVSGEVRLTLELA